MSSIYANFEGNVTKDAELSTTGNGGSILKFTVAANSREKVGGEWVDACTFVPCVMFGKRAESLAKYIVKGARVIVTNGRMSEHRWEYEGKNYRRWQCAVLDISLAGRGKAQEQVDEVATVEQNFPGADIQQAPAPGAYDDEDIPF